MPRCRVQGSAQPLGPAPGLQEPAAGGRPGTGRAGGSGGGAPRRSPARAWQSPGGPRGPPPPGMGEAARGPGLPRTVPVATAAPRCSPPHGDEDRPRPRASATLPVTSRRHQWRQGRAGDVSSPSGGASPTLGRRPGPAPYRAAAVTSGAGRAEACRR